MSHIGLGQYEDLIYGEWPLVRGPAWALISLALLVSYFNTPALRPFMSSPAYYPFRSPPWPASHPTAPSTSTSPRNLLVIFPTVIMRSNPDWTRRARHLRRRPLRNGPRRLAGPRVVEHRPSPQPPPRSVGAQAAAGDSNQRRRLATARSVGPSCSTLSLVDMLQMLFPMEPAKHRDRVWTAYGI